MEEEIDLAIHQAFSVVRNIFISKRVNTLALADVM